MESSQPIHPSPAKPNVHDSHRVLETLREKNCSIAPPLILSCVPTPPVECLKYFRFIVHSSGVRVLVRPSVDIAAASKFLVDVYESIRQCLADEKQEAVLSNAFKVFAPWMFQPNSIMMIASAFKAFLGMREDALCLIVSPEVVTWLTQMAFVNHMGNLCSVMFCFPSADVASLIALFSSEVGLQNQGTELFCAVVTTMASINMPSHALVGPSPLLIDKLRDIGFPIPKVLKADYLLNFRGHVSICSNVHLAAVQLICELLSVQIGQNRKLSLIHQLLDHLPMSDPGARERLWTWAIDFLQLNN